MDWSGTINWILSIGFTMTIILTAVIIVLENRNPSKTVTWLVVLYVLPIIGFVIYIFFGRNFRKKKRFKGKVKINQLDHTIEQVIETQNQVLKQKDTFLNEEYYSKKRLINLLLQTNQAPFTLNNQAQVLTNADQKFAAVFAAIDQAKHHIHIEYFIIKDDEIGNTFRDRLLMKIKQGVQVRIIYDGAGSWRLDINGEYFKPLIDAGAEVHCFAPIRIHFLNSKINYRNHRKIIVVDGETGFVGGINIGDEYLGRSEKFGFWRDTHLQIKGDAVYFLQNIFIEDWHFITGQYLKAECYFPPHCHVGNQLIQIAASGPDSEWNSIMQLYYATMASAEERIYIISPYFIPDDSILMALMTAALSGLDVRIIIPNIPDHHIVFWATQSYMADLLQAGVKVYQYKKGFVHAKVMMVDGVVASVGTANMDIRSFQLNFEVNAFLYDKQIVARLEEDFMKDIADSRLITYEEYQERPFLNKVKESGARLLSPLL